MDLVAFVLIGIDMLATDLENDSNWPCDDLFLAALIFSIAFVTLSLLNPFSVTRKVINP